MEDNLDFNNQQVWDNHTPKPKQVATFKRFGIHAQFQEMQYDDRGSWDATMTDLHLASLVTPTQHRYGASANKYHAVAPSSSVVLPGDRLVGGWEGKMVGQHLFISEAQFAAITGTELASHNIMPYDFTLQSETTPEVDIIVNLLAILAHDARHESPAGPIFAETIISALLQNLTGSKAKIWGYGATKGQNADKITNFAIDILQANLTNGVSLMDVSKQIGVSVQYLCRMFKQSTGMSPHQYLLRERVFMARKLILEGDTPLAEIALEVGFTDQSKLSTTFKNILGYSPSQLRN
ncbi:MAG: helix-turn-helix transcriptional regulator [Alphaproteobacteria bacterium]|nr:helix-turn-helix transcriptional regulator [Alphaproteobacteria bacterium]